MANNLRVFGPPHPDAAVPRSLSRLLILGSADDPHVLRIREAAAQKFYAVHIWDSARVHIDMPVAILPDGSLRMQALTPGGVMAPIEDFSRRDIVLLRRLPPPKHAESVNTPALERSFSHFIQGLMLQLGETTRMYPDFLASLRCERKLHQFQKARQAGLDLPDTVIGNDAECASRLFERHRDVCFKPLKAEGWIGPTGRSAIMPTRRISADQLDVDSVRGFPGIFQSLVAKEAEVRAVITAQSAFAVQQAPKDTTATDEVDWRLNPQHFQRSVVEIPTATVQASRRLLDALGLNFGIFDFAVCNRRWYFLEVNPFGNFLNFSPETDCLGVDMILESLEGDHDS